MKHDILQINECLSTYQGSESNNRWWRFFREHFAPQISVATSLKYPFLRKLEMADPEILKINAGFVLRKKSSRTRTRLPPEVIALLTPEGRAKHLAETEEPVEHMEIDDPAQRGVNPEEVDAADEGLDDLIIVIDDGEGGEQVHHVHGEPMDIGINDLVINVNEAGDYHVQDRS